MIRKLKRITLQIVAGANVATILLMLLVGLSGWINPARNPFFANLGLGFPVMMLINLGFVVFWLCFHKRWVLIPLLGFVVCYFPVRAYMPFNLPGDPPEGSVKVMSYNVQGFIGLDTTYAHDYPILQYIEEQDPDILCLQESSCTGIVRARTDSVLLKLMPYRADINAPGTAKGGGDVVTVFSKYNILHYQLIPYKSKGNVSAAFWINVKGSPVIVINNHLETTGLSLEDRSQFKTMMKGDMQGDSAKTESHRIFDKLNAASAKRAPQAEAVARFIASHSGESIICTGDFNDSPLSYAHNTIADGLTDCYISTGNGPGISYHKGGFYVRIDNIMCSSDWKPYGCKVDAQIATSDHYPIICWLKKQPKPKNR